MSLRGIIRGVGRRWLIALAIVLLLFLLYLWAGYVLAPRLIRSEAMRWARSRPGLTLALGTIKVDPLHFTVSVRNISLTERQQPLASLGRLFVGLQPLALLAGTYHFTALELDSPRLHVVLGANGKLNLAALAAPASGKPSAPQQIRIDDLRIDQGELNLTDRQRSPAARETLAPITLRLVDFRSWGGSGGRFALQAASADGARLNWWGQLSMAPLASSGGLSLAGVALTELARFLPPLPVRPRAGVLGLSAEYSLAKGAHGLTLGVSDLGMTARSLALDGGSLLNGSVRVSALEATGGALHLAAGTAHASLGQLTFKGVRVLGSASARGQTVSLQRLSLAQARVNLPDHRIAVGTLALRGLRLPVQRGKRGRLWLLRLLATARPAPARAHAPAQRAAAAKWHLRLGRFELRDAAVPVRDLAVSPAAHFELRLYSLTARALSTNLDRPVPFTLHAGLAPRAYLVLDGRVTPGRDSAALWVSLTRLPLRPFVPYLPLARTAEVHSGTVGARGFAELATGRLVRLSGRADVRSLQLIERATGVGLFGWRELSLGGILYRPGHLLIGRARLEAPAGQIVILPNRTLNLAALAPPAKHAGQSPRVARAPSARAKRSAPALAVVLKRLQIINGSIRFADESIEPHFHAPIEDLHGTISNVSTSKQAIARIVLAGQVINRYSPVSVSGTFNPYGLGGDTDIRAAFDNIQLPIFDPYADHYAGYAIAKGILSAHFRYRIDDRKLDADHHIVIDQLQWGGASASKQRVGWPIRLATALLKNRDGVIRINLPVTGSLNNPDFHIASIVWMMLVHLLEKAALAPFDLIGKLFAGAAQAQYIAFEPGSAALPHAAAASLAALAHALAKRPALRLDIPAGPAGRDDARAIENEHIDALALARLNASPPGGFASLKPPEQLRALARLYRARLGKRPLYPAHLPAPPALPGKAAAGKAAASATTNKRAARERSEIRWLRQQLRPTVHPDPGTLAALGMARAENVQQALLAHGRLSAQRIFITTQQAGAPWHGRIRLKLRLQ